LEYPGRTQETPKNNHLENREPMVRGNMVSRSYEEERLQEVKRKTLMFKRRVVEMDWNTVVEDKNMEMEWMEYEQKEHEELSKFMEQLELEYGIQRKECEGQESS
jgi:hypothetical protein